jgi:hypothetical protein
VLMARLLIQLIRKFNQNSIGKIFIASESLHPLINQGYILKLNSLVF